MTPVRLPAEPASGAEFLARFGDTIDDRIAETLDELLAQRDPPRRWPVFLSCGCLIAAAVAVSLVWHSAVAWVIWPVTTVLCLSLTRLSGRRPAG